MADALKEEFMIGALTGKTEKEMTDSINEQFLSGRNKARRLVRTESSYIHNEAHFQAYKDYGIEEYRFVATLDLRTSQICRERDGSVYRVNDKKIGVNAPPMHPWCRSTTIMNLDDETMHNLERFARDPVTGERMKVPADETYKEWHKRMVEKHGADAINTAEKLVENRSSDRKQQIKYLDLLGKQNIPLSLSEFQNLKYNDKENWLLLQKYKRSRSSGKLSAFSTFEDYKKYRKIIQDEIVGRTTKDGVVIKSQSDHFIERVLGTTEKEGPQKNKKREGVEIEDVISALTDPEKIIEKENGKRISRKYIGENVEVTLNPDTGNLIQTNPKKRE